MRLAKRAVRILTRWSLGVFGERLIRDGTELLLEQLRATATTGLRIQLTQTIDHADDYGVRAS